MSFLDLYTATIRARSCGSIIEIIINFEKKPLSPDGAAPMARPRWRGPDGAAPMAEPRWRSPDGALYMQNDVGR